MKYVIIDIIDDFKSVELSQKGHDIFATVALVITSLWDVVFCGSFGPIFQIIFFAAFIASACWFISKTSFGHRFLESINGYDE